VNGDAEFASDTGRELGLPALTHQMFATTLRALLLFIKCFNLFYLIRIINYFSALSKKQKAEHTMLP